MIQVTALPSKPLLPAKVLFVITALKSHIFLFIELNIAVNVKLSQVYARQDSKLRLVGVAMYFHKRRNCLSTAV